MANKKKGSASLEPKVTILVLFIFAVGVLLGYNIPRDSVYFDDPNDVAAVATAVPVRSVDSIVLTKDLAGKILITEKDKFAVGDKIYVGVKIKDNRSSSWKGTLSIKANSNRVDDITLPMKTIGGVINLYMSQAPVTLVSGENIIEAVVGSSVLKRVIVVSGDPKSYVVEFSQTSTINFPSIGGVMSYYPIWKNIGNKSWSKNIKPVYRIYRTVEEASADPSNVGQPVAQGLGVFVGRAANGEIVPQQLAGINFQLDITNAKGMRLSSGTYYVQWSLMKPNDGSFIYTTQGDRVVPRVVALSLTNKSPVEAPLVSKTGYTKMIVGEEKQAKVLLQSDFSFFCNPKGEITDYYRGVNSGPAVGERAWSCDAQSELRNMKFSFATNAGTSLIVPFKLYRPTVVGYDKPTSPVSISAVLTKTNTDGTEAAVTDPSLAQNVTSVVPLPRGGDGAFIVLSTSSTPKGIYNLKLSTPENQGMGYAITIK